MTSSGELPIPAHFDEQKVSEVWRVPYQERAAAARDWANRHQITPAATDRTRICLMCIDVQNTFCIPGFELFVGGCTGQAAVEDNIRLARFIYRNLGAISEIAFTLDTHFAHQIFHPSFWVNEQGEHPAPYTLIPHAEVREGRWKVNPAITRSITGSNAYVWLQNYALHYTAELERKGRYQRCIWPFHAMLGGVGHAVVAAVEEVAFFHAIARNVQTGYEIKGANVLTENYSPFSTEVAADHEGRPIAQKNTRFIDKLLRFDAVIIAGQAKSHCVAWAIDDLLTDITRQDPALARKVYLLEDCTSPVVVPGLDFTAEADAAFARFAAAGMNVVRSTEPLANWPGLTLG